MRQRSNIELSQLSPVLEWPDPMDGHFQVKDKPKFVTQCLENWSFEQGRSGVDWRKFRITQSEGFHS